MGKDEHVKFFNIADKMMWKIFLLKKGKNTFLASCILFFNILAALLEGVSFALLLASFAILTGEKASLSWIDSLFFKTDNLFLTSLAGAIGLQILRSVSVYLAQLMTTYLTLNIQHEAQAQIFKRIFRMPYSEVAQYKKGDLMQLAGLPPTFIPLLFDEYNRFVTCLMMSGAYLVFMLCISFTLTCFNVFIFALFAFVQRLFFAKIMHASQAHADHISELSQQTAQSLEGIKIVHLFQRQKHQLGKIKTILHEITNTTLKMKKWNALIPCLNETVGIILVGCSLLLGVWILQDKAAYTARLFIFLTLTYRLGTRLQVMMIAKGMISTYSGQIKRLEFLNTPMENPEAITMRPLCFDQHIIFDRVCFAYPQQSTYALKNISLKIPRKKIVALVGISGAGKSSLIDLLLRLYPPTEGLIYLDDQPAEKFPLPAWRKLFGVVPQDAFLFHATIEENIRFGHLNASSSDIARAAEMAGAAPFIQRLPQGYQTVIGEKGYRLSGGERQRISLAQALVKDPEILVLDEATSHLDSDSEQMVQNALSTLHHHKTMLVVAHRLSTIQMADLIYVLENGRIIESGTHTDLLNLGGRYQTFWHLQTMHPLIKSEQV
jgi:ATP-binding cassette, subfamily B, bacterial MsbA